MNAAAWERHAQQRQATRMLVADPPESFRLAQCRDVGPGTELLGDLAGVRVAELGCGAGDNLAHVASHGVAIAIGVDLSAGQIERARTKWGHLSNIRFLVADARTFLADHTAYFDVCYSVFGAVEFCPAEQLLPLAAARLRPTGRLLLSIRHPASPPASHLSLPDGTRAPLIRYRHSVVDWINLVTRAGLTVTTAHEVQASTDITASCLIIVAIRPPTRGGHAAQTR